MPDNLARVEEPTPGRPPHAGFISVTMVIDRGGTQEVGNIATARFEPGKDNEPLTVEVLARTLAAWYINWCEINQVK